MDFEYLNVWPKNLLRAKSYQVTKAIQYSFVTIAIA